MLLNFSDRTGTDLTTLTLAHPPSPPYIAALISIVKGPVKTKTITISHMVQDECALIAKPKVFSSSHAYFTHACLLYLFILMGFFWEESKYNDVEP